MSRPALEIRPLAIDVTHLVSRLNRLATTGIDRVDLAYARHFAQAGRIACGLHYGLQRPHVFSPARVERLVQRFSSKLREDLPASEDPAWPQLRRWLLDDAPAPQPASRLRPADQGWQAFATQSAFRIVDDTRTPLPHGAAYLNVAQSGFEVPRFFRWLERRPDVVPIFLVHDLLPIDRPEFFPAGYQVRFQRRVDTITRYAKALITTSDVVRDRILQEYRTRGLTAPPIQVLHTPSPLGGPPAADEFDEALSAEPYFVHVATIEPRKNHSLLLHLWREWRAVRAPKLVLIGARGWNSDQTQAMLDRAPGVVGRVHHVSGLSRRAMRVLIANARALLMPSFDEGYGLPVVEALTLGVPVIATDIPVFHEVSADRAEFINPLDGLGWRNAIEDFAKPASARRQAAVGRAGTFPAPDEARYFDDVAAFVRGV